MKIDNENWIKMIICLAPSSEEAQSFLNYNCGVRYALSTIRKYREEFKSSDYSNKSWSYINELINL